MKTVIIVLYTDIFAIRFCNLLLRTHQNIKNGPFFLVISEQNVNIILVFEKLK